MNFGNCGLLVKADSSQPRGHKFEPWHRIYFLWKKSLLIRERERERARERERDFINIYRPNLTLQLA